MKYILKTTFFLDFNIIIISYIIISRSDLMSKNKRELDSCDLDNVNRSDLIKFARFARS